MRVINVIMLYYASYFLCKFIEYIWKFWKSFNFFLWLHNINFFWGYQILLHKASIHHIIVYGPTRPIGHAYPTNILLYIEVTMSWEICLTLFKEHMFGMVTAWCCGFHRRGTCKGGAQVSNTQSCHTPDGLYTKRQPNLTKNCTLSALGRIETHGSESCLGSPLRQKLDAPQHVRGPFAVRPDYQTFYPAKGAQSLLHRSRYSRVSS